MGPLFVGGLAGQFLDVFLHERQVQIAQLLVQFIRRRLGGLVRAHGVLHDGWFSRGGIGVSGFGRQVGCRGGIAVGGVQAEVGFGQFQVQQVLAAGQVQGPGFGQQALPLLQQVGDVFATEGLELQGILDGPGGSVGAVDLRQGHDLADVMEDVEPPLRQAQVERLGLGRQASSRRSSF